MNSTMNGKIALKHGQDRCLLIRAVPAEMKAFCHKVRCSLVSLPNRGGKRISIRKAAEFSTFRLEIIRKNCIEVGILSSYWLVSLYFLSSPSLH